MSVCGKETITKLVVDHALLVSQVPFKTPSLKLFATPESNIGRSSPSKWLTSSCGSKLSFLSEGFKMQYTLVKSSNIDAAMEISPAPFSKTQQVA
jgi:hypothetical protein